MDDIYKYYPVLEEVIKEKGYNNFWLICENTEFKPMFMSREEIIERVKKNVLTIISNVWMMIWVDRVKILVDNSMFIPEIRFHSL